MSKREGIMIRSLGLSPIRRIDWEMLVNLRCAMYSEIGLHAKTICDLIETEFGETMTCGQLHNRNRARGRKLRDARDNNTHYMNLQVKAIQSWQAKAIKKLAPIPQKQLTGGV